MAPSTRAAARMAARSQEVMERIEGHTRPDVSLAVDAAKVNVKLSREPLEQVLLHLLSNAAIHTIAAFALYLKCFRSVFRL